MIRSDHDEQHTGKTRNLLWVVLGGMAFCATMMTVMMVTGPKLMGRMCGKMKGMMQMCNAENPIEILKRRYASGEITEDEFLRIKQKLEK